MRRFYDTGSNDHDPALPRRHVGSDEPQSFRSVNSTALSTLLVPTRLRRRALSVEVSTPRGEFPVGSTIPFSVTIRNPIPVPLAVRTRSPIEWTWQVDGHTEASHVSLHDPPDEPGVFRLSRGTRTVFRKRWNGYFRVGDREWKPAGPGEHTIGARLNVEHAERDGLADETTIRLVRE